MSDRINVTDETKPLDLGIVAQLDNWFSYHVPKPGDAERFERIRAAGRKFAEVVFEECPHQPGASSEHDRRRAITKIREAVYCANAAIACSYDDPLCR